MCIYLELKHIIIDEMTLPSPSSLAFSPSHIQYTLFTALNLATLNGAMNLNLYVLNDQSILPSNSQINKNISNLS